MKIKSPILLIFALLINQVVFSQYYGGALFHFKNPNFQPRSSWKYWDQDYQDEGAGLLTAKKRKNLGIKEISYQRIGKKGKVSSQKIVYNSQGRLLTTKTPKFERKSTYLNDTIEIGRFTVYKGKSEEFKKNYENGKVILDERFEKGKLVSKTENTFVNNYLVNAKLLHKGKNHEMKYTFNEENKLTKTEYYKKGKLKQTWNYECKPEGQILASVKHEMISSKCEYREESADGSYATFTRTIIEGEPRLHKETFSKDSVKIKEEKFIKDSILTYFWSNVNDVETKEYYKKGRLKNSEINTYNKDLRLSEKKFLKKGKLKSTKKEFFNDSKKCIRKVKIKNDKEKKIETFEYDIAGNLIKEEEFRKGKFKLARFHEFDASGNKTLYGYSRKKDRSFDFKSISVYNENGTMKSQENFKKGKFYSRRDFTYEY